MLHFACVVDYLDDDGFYYHKTHFDCKIMQFGTRLFVIEPERKTVTKYRMEDVKEYKIYG